MQVFLLKDVVGVGISGSIVSVSDGYAQNFLLPKKLAIAVTPANELQLKNRVHAVAVQKEQVATKTSLLAQKVQQIELKITRKMHDDDRLYGALSALDIVELLAAEGISVAKNQIIFDKPIKTKGIHSVTIKLSNSLRPICRIKVVPEKGI